MGVFGLPISNLKLVMGYLSSNYRSRMFKCYVLNSTSSLQASWGLLKGLLDEVTTNKISFNDSAVAQAMFSHIKNN
jgi:hypothetical protein